MHNSVMLYVSAANDLAPEREILGRAVTQVPVSLGWRIIQSPGRDDPVDLDAVARASVHLLLLGSDIRAPVGLEWQTARRAGRWPVPFLKQGILRTPAAQNFVRYLGSQATWRPFKDGADLRAQVLKLLGGWLLERAGFYALSPLEVGRLEDWLSSLDTLRPAPEGETGEGAGDSGVLLSPERYEPSDGILIAGGDAGRKR
jgi:hypothetical protein